MNSSAYYVRRGLRFSLKLYRKHFTMIFISLIIEIAKLLSYCLVFLAPAFNKMQFNFNKMLNETGEANYAKSFDDSDRGSAYLTRLLYFGISILIACVISGILPLVVFGLEKGISTLFEQFNQEKLDTVHEVFKNVFVFTYILGGLLGFVSFVFIQVGNYISCASNQLSLGDIFYNTILTMKKNGPKILLTCFLYLLMIASVVFVFGLPLLIVYRTTFSEEPEIFITVVTVFSLILGVILIFALPIFLTSYRMSLHLMFEKCAELDKRVVIVDRKDIHGNIVRVNVLPYSEKTKTIEANLEELNYPRKNIDK